MNSPPLRFPPDRDQPSHQWFPGPPAGEPGCMVAIRKTVATAVDVEILLTNVVAFSTGFAFVVEIAGAKAKTYDVHGLEYFDGGPVRSVLRFGIELEDGRRATNLDRITETRRPGNGLISYATSSRPAGRTVSVWSWPLPPGRRTTFACDWIALGVDFTRVELDAVALRAAGTRSRRLALP